MDLSDKDELLKFLKSRGLWAKKSLGQNFLVSAEVLSNIITAASLSPTDQIVEVGPGLGTLTQLLIEKVNSVLAVEKDYTLAAMLPQTIKSPKLKVLTGSILDTDLRAEVKGPYKVVANIPYYLTSPLLRYFLTEQARPELMVLMVQKEVAERVAAKPGSMSLLAVYVQFYADVEIVCKVPKINFYPAPKVDSAVIKITPKKELPLEDVKGFFRVAKAAFSQNRKTLANTLSAGLSTPKEEIITKLNQAGIDPTRRAETLTFPEWQALYAIIYPVTKE